MQPPSWRRALILRFLASRMKNGLTEIEATEWIERSNESWSSGHPRFAIVDAVDERLLGQVGVAVNEHLRSGEAYYWVARDARRRRVASNALGLVADWVFSKGVERLFLLVHPENAPSHRVAQRCGFTREGVLRAYEPFKGRRPDLMSWSLLPQDPRPWHTETTWPCPIPPDRGRTERRDRTGDCDLGARTEPAICVSITTSTYVPLGAS
jgi:RimJ/RimL family protein N-acetyltransferase